MEYGSLYFTAGIAGLAHRDGSFLFEIIEAFARYQLGDWGDLCKEDQEQNERAILCGGRLMGSYRTQRGGKIWIITEAGGEDGHRAATTVLFPDEY